MTMNNPRMEQALIGTVIGYPTEASNATDVQPQDLSYRSHQVLWNIILELEKKNGLSYQAVVEKLHAANEISNLGNDVEDGDITGELYLEELLSRRAQPSLRTFADAVINASIKRQLHSLAHLWAIDSESAKEADELLDVVEEQIYRLRRNRIDTGRDIGDILSTYEQIMDDWRNDLIKPAFLFTTPGLAKIVPFLEPTDFMLIAGRPGEGKSSVVRAEAFEAAMRGQKVVIFNLENSEVEYARYLIAYMTGINTWDLRQPKNLSERQVEQVRQAINTLKSLPLKVVSLGSPSVYEIIRIARKLAAQGYEVIFVDYIQLIKNGIENEVQDINMSSALLRGFALKYNVPVIAAAQLNRELVRRAVGAKPQLSDLRGSGCLEQDATIVLFTYLVEADENELRQFVQNQDPDGGYTIRAVPMQLFCQKNRNGPIDKTMPMLWQKHINRFTQLTAQNPTQGRPARRQRATTQQAELPA